MNLKRIFASPSAKIKEALADARAAVTAAEHDEAALRDARAALVADPVELARNREAIRQAGERREDGELVVAALVERLAVVEREEEQGRRRTAYAERKHAVDAASAALAGYRKAAEPLLQLLRVVELGFVAADNANNELPDGLLPLAVNDPATVPPLAAKVVSENVVALWCHTDGLGPLGEEFQRKVREQGDGAGLIPSNVTAGTRVVKRQFLRRERLPAIDGVIGEVPTARRVARHPRAAAKTTDAVGLRFLAAHRTRHPGGGDRHRSGLPVSKARRAAQASRCSRIRADPGAQEYSRMTAEDRRISAESMRKQIAKATGRVVPPPLVAAKPAENGTYWKPQPKPTKAALDARAMSKASMVQELSKSQSSVTDDAAISTAPRGR